jgi:hypothetical protein
VSDKRPLTIPSVTSEDLWRAVGAQLRDIRVRKGFATPAEFYGRFREPAANTITTIEAGKTATLAPVETYCRVLGVSLPDVLRQALGKESLAADAVRVARAYQHCPNEGLRHAAWALALVMEREPAPTTPVPPPSDAPRNVVPGVASDMPPRGRGPRALR